MTTYSRRTPCLAAATSVAVCSLAFVATCPPAPSQDRQLYAKTFDHHWERLRDDYPYFELYGVDWDAERKLRRPKAIAAKNDSEFAHEMVRLIAKLPDPHVSFVPRIETIVGKWSYPDIPTVTVGRRVYVREWLPDALPEIPAAFANDARAFPEITTVDGVPLAGVAELLVAGPLGSTVALGIRWPDGSEARCEFARPKVSNIKSPKKKHHGKKWLVIGRVGAIGYMRIKTFDPKFATLGPDGKMTTMLRAALRELAATDGLILDLQDNGGGLVAASDPFLGNIVAKQRTYAWGRSGGKQRVIRPRSPRYTGKVVVLVNQKSASGGEWAAHILRDAGRAVVIGERTAGAEAAVHESQGPDGSVLRFSGWPMAQPGVTPFQHRGISLDHDLPLTIESVRKLGFDEARQKIRRERLAKALAVLGAPPALLDELVKIAAAADEPAGQ